MDRREFVQSTVAAMLPAPLRAKQSRPNILFILPDQLRAQSLGCMGDPNVRSPHIDRLAGDGVLFRNTIANTPVCCPARANLLTGRYAHKNGMVANDLRLGESQVTLPALLGDAGYRTGFIGKWHLDGGQRLPGFVPPGPRRHGFEFWAANECSHSHFDTHYFRDTAQPLPIRKFEPEAWTDLAIEFLRCRDERPFFLTVQMGPPHDPYRAPLAYSNLYDPARLELRLNYRAEAGTPTRRMIAEYYGMVTAVDDQVGRLMRELDALHLADGTIVMLCSDHGDMLGSHGERLKRKPWDESIRVPGIIRYPRAIRGGRTSDVFFTHVDFAPTMLSLCGVRVPVQMQGTDLSKVVTGASETGPEEALLQIFGPYHGDGTEGGWRGIRTARHTYARYRERPWVLYDNDRDPYQMENLVSDAALVARMEMRLDKLMKRTDDSWANNWTYPVEDDGRLYGDRTYYSVNEYLDDQGNRTVPRSIDISSSGQAGARRAVIFYATAGVPSHAFVAFEQEDATARQSVAQAVGFYPHPEEGFGRTLVTRVRGAVQDDMRQTSALPRAVETLVVYVSLRQYRAAQRTVARWRCEGSYRLMKQDCVTFTEEIAQTLGLRTPPRSWKMSRPVDWLRRLIQLN